MPNRWIFSPFELINPDHITELWPAPELGSAGSFNAMSRSIIMGALALYLWRPTEKRLIVTLAAGALMWMQVFWSSDDEFLGIGESEAGPCSIAAPSTSDSQSSSSTTTSTDTGTTSDTAASTTSTDTVNGLDTYTTAARIPFANAPDADFTPNIVDPLRGEVTRAGFQTGGISGTLPATRTLKPQLRPKIANDPRNFLLAAERMVSGGREAPTRKDIQGDIEDRLYACRPTGNLENIASEDMSFLDGAIGRHRISMRPGLV